MAESEGFEPPIPLRVPLISNQVPSAARPALRKPQLHNIVGGEGGIRTHDTFPYTRFPSVRLRPLGHLSSYFVLRWRKNSCRSAAHSPTSTAPIGTSPSAAARRASARASAMKVSSMVAKERGAGV